MQPSRQHDGSRVVAIGDFPSDRYHYRVARVDLGPLEPLREAAERARVGASCKACSGAGWRYRDGKQCPRCAGRKRIYPLRLVVACAPDDGVCLGCGGEGKRYVEGGFAGLGRARPCWDCSGTGKALSGSGSDGSGPFWTIALQNGPLNRRYGCSRSTIRKIEGLT